VSLHQQWRDFVCDPTRPGRFLSNIGRSVIADDASAIDSEILTEFLSRLSGAGADVELLGTAVDLYHPDYANFFCTVLPSLLDVLANERAGNAAIVGPGLKGNPLWDKTAVARRSGKILSTHYVTRLPVRSFVLPENLLVRWVVGAVAKAIHALESRIGSGGFPERFVLIRTACDEALSHHWFGQVPPPSAPTVDMFSTAKRQRNPAYRQAARLAERRVAREVGAAASRWLRTLDLLKANWLSPENTDDLFELYALTLVLDILEKEFGFGMATEFGLAIPGRSHVALFEHEQLGRVRVFFDQSPFTVLGTRSRYREIVAAHKGALGVARRPDVIVARYLPGTPHPTVMLFEVKESRDTAYTSDSIYKAMGYAFDFQSLWEVGAACPKVALLFPEEISRNADCPVSGLDVTLISSLDRSSLVEAMRSRLGAPEVSNVGSQ
jgi:hypothetical protein